MAELRRISPGIRGPSGAVRAIAVSQEGVVGRAQLLERGVGTSAIDRALNCGALQLIHPGVYSVVGPELLSEDGHLIAALMAAGPGALLGHGTAAWRWQIIPAPPTTIELSVPRDRAAPDGVAVFRRRALRAGDMAWSGRFPSTSVARTLLDLAARYDRWALLRALAEAEFQHDLRPEDVQRVLRRGHRGSANLRAAVSEHAPGHGQAKSQLECRFRALLVRSGIELPLRNHAVGPWVVDCLWPERQVVAELDGGQHARPHQADSDHERDLWLRRNRYLVRRYGTEQVTAQPAVVIADLLEAFAEAIKLGYSEPAPGAQRTRK
jgi:very-short-patch-repair endonuclease